MILQYSAGLLYEYDVASLVLLRNYFNPQPNPNTTLLHIIIVNIYRAAQEIMPSRWVSKSWNRYFYAVIKELPRALYFVFLLIIWTKKICTSFFLSRSHVISDTYILPVVGNTPYRKHHNTRTICITPLQSILVEGLHLRQYFLVRLTNQFHALLNPKNASETKATNKCRCSKQIFMMAVSRDSCRAASVTMFHPTNI